MKPKFSLRLFVGLFTLIAIWLGAREAIRSYHWHRNLPVTLYFQSEQRDSQENSLHVKATFDRAEVERVRAAAAKHREAVAKDKFDNLVENGSNRFYRNFGYYRSPFFYFGPKQRDVIQERARTWFFRNPDLSVPLQLRLFGFLMHTRDPVALEFAAEQLEQVDPTNHALLLSALDQSLCQSHWVTDEVCMEEAVEKYLKRDRVSEDYLNWFGRSGFDHFDARICELIANDRVDLEPETLAKVAMMNLPPEDLHRQIKAERLAARMRLGAYYFGTSTERVVLLLRAFAEDARELVGTSQFDSAELRDKFWRYFSEATWRFDFRSKENQNARAEIAELMLTINCIPLFLAAADETHKEKVEWIFENRERFLVPNDEFLKSLPNPRSGFDSAISHEWLAHTLDALCTLDAYGKEFTQPKLLQLMREGSPAAFVYAGNSWEGTDDPEVTQLLKGRLRELQSKLNGKNAKWQLRDEAYEVYQSLIKVAPWEATQVIPVERYSSGYPYEEPEETVEEMRACFRNFGLRLRDPYWRNDHEDEATACVMLNRRLAHVIKGPLDERCETLLNASIGVFEPDVYVHPPEGGVRLVEVALDQCVYQFEIREDCKTPQMLFCDVFNHILERQRIGYRFAPASNKEIWFVQPQLLNELRDRFKIRFADGVEGYLPAGD